MSRRAVTSRDKPGSAAGYDWRRLGRVLSLAAFVASTAGAIACAVICLVSSVPVPPVPVAVWASLVGGVIPMNILAGLGPDRTENRWIMPALALFLVCFVSGIVQLGHGVPEVIHGAYYQDSHGTLTRVSHDTYVWAFRAAARMFGGGGCVGYVFAAGRHADRWRDD
jgi:hypothetical protein